LFDAFAVNFMSDFDILQSGNPGPHIGHGG